MCFFLVLIISSYATEVIGIHALFGAFMAGVIMPDVPKFRTIFIEKVEDVALILLLPLFFVFTGLKTEIGLLNDPYLWKVTGFIILVAVVGKFLGSALAAKFVGQSWRDSLTIGALMNTRGLMELIVLNIGLELKVLTPEVFTMMVIMALVTTFMTGPALDLINFIFKTKDGIESPELTNHKKYRILVSFGNNEKGKVKPTFKVNGKKAAQIMIISGCDLDGSMNFPDWEYNLRFALRIQKERLEKLVIDTQKQLDVIERKMLIGDNRRQLIEQYTNLEHLDRETVEKLIDYVLVGKKDPVTKEIPIEIHWNF